jgi:hypothetical protein
MAICLEEKTSRTWTIRHVLNSAYRSASPVLHVHCTRTAATNLRLLTLRPHTHQETIPMARQRLQSREFKERHATRTRAEGNVSQGV